MNRQRIKYCKNCGGDVRIEKSYVYDQRTGKIKRTWFMAYCKDYPIADGVQKTWSERGER